jgi:predicted Zn-dependent protease
MHFGGNRASSIEDLIAGTERGVLITNFWYIRYVNPTDLTLTGMTRDGTFLIEDGKIVAGLKNFRFHDSPLRAFREVAAATAPMESITMERGKMMLPAVRLPQFHLSSVTKF